MLARLKPRFKNWMDSDRKVKKLGVSLHYYLFKHRLWEKVWALDNKSMFTEIYKNNLWNNEESRSGGGSTLKKTQKIRKGLQDLLKEECIGSLCDAGCGDFNWMKELDLAGVSYTGIDIVKAIVIANQARYEKDNLVFREMDITKDDLPSFDLILCREVLFHLPFTDVCRALNNFKKSGSKYFLTTHFPNIQTNIDVKMGQCRGINFERPPLNFSPPLRVIEEDVWDHALALWKFDDIKPYMLG
ncbi:MAG: class I SAM-dependent methyltransferase [Nitrospira sp.]